MSALEIEHSDVPLTGETEAYIRNRAEHLRRLHPQVTLCRVSISAPASHHQQGGPFRVAVEVSVPGSKLSVNRRQAPDLRLAIRKAFEAARRQVASRGRIQRQQVRAHTAVHLHGEVGRLFPDDGYGFIQADDGREVYFHQSAVLSPGFGQLRAGMRVRFADELGDKGPRATSVEPL